MPTGTAVPLGWTKGMQMVVLGLVLLILGLVLGSSLLWTIGLVLLVVGAVLWLAHTVDQPWGRRWY
jgi:hypothetical protein